MYYAEQLNKINISLSGEANRLVPDAYFANLYSYLDSFEAVVQQSTTSTRDIQHQLHDHLSLLLAVLNGV